MAGILCSFRHSKTKAESKHQTQVKLYRVPQEGKVRPIGSTEESDVDVRIIAATNKEFEKEIAEGRFREDLNYRIVLA